MQIKQKLKKYVAFGGAAVALFFPVFFVIAETPKSNNLELNDSTFGAGGEIGSSNNFQSRGILNSGENQAQESQNFSNKPGFIFHSFPGRPGAPLFFNKDGIQYDSLYFILNPGGNQPDANFAIGVSKDNFSTFMYIQENGDLGEYPKFQTYEEWGGIQGKKIYGLMPETEYQIRTKAAFGPDTESGWSIPAKAKTSKPILAFEILGLPLGAKSGNITSNVESGPVNLDFGLLYPGSIRIAGQQIKITTNAENGYMAFIKQNHDLIKDNGVKINPVDGTNLAPQPWPLVVENSAFGYRTHSKTLCEGDINRFVPEANYASMEQKPGEIACSTGPVSNESTNLFFKVEIGPKQPAGNYFTQIEYIISPIY